MPFKQVTFKGYQVKAYLDIYPWIGRKLADCAFILNGDIKQNGHLMVILRKCSFFGGRFMYLHNSSRCNSRTQNVLVRRDIIVVGESHHVAANFPFRGNNKAVDLTFSSSRNFQPQMYLRK